jgi:cbb3-type cytochrome oxidase subunit 3
MVKRFFIIFICLFSFLLVQAQKESPAQSDMVQVDPELPDETEPGMGAIGIMPMDTMLVSRPVFIEPDTIQEWKNKKEFRYIKNLDSLLKALQAKENEKAAMREEPPKRSFINEFLDAPFLKTLLIMLALFFVAVILHHLLKNQGIFKRVTVIAPAKEVESEEDELLENDYEKLVHQAYKLGDYRMAVRYLFLKTLQDLRDSNHIEYTREKTNSRYARELPPEMRNDFSRLTLAYEYVWYGNFPVSKDQFDTIQKQFSAFFNKI